MIRRPDQLYDLLPALYRQRDLQLGSPLRAVFAILQDQSDLLETDIQSLYDNWFVETCEPWVLAYIGELVAAGRLGRRQHPRIDTRSLVANTLAYRRRKGTAATLQAALEQATGWPSRVVEPRSLIAATPAIRGSGEPATRTLDFRDRACLASVGGAFERAARMATVRPDPPLGSGRLGVSLWRLRSYPVEGVTAAMIDGRGDRRTFHPLGLDQPLFNRRRSPNPLEIDDVRCKPSPITRAALRVDLAEWQAKPDGPPRDNLFCDPVALNVSIGAPDAVLQTRLGPEDLVVADLSHWTVPRHSGAARVALDPERGRLLMLKSDDREAKVSTDHSYGFADDIGGGCYDRPIAPSSADRLHRRAWLDPARVWTWEGAASAADLEAALSRWCAQPEDGVIQIQGCGTVAPQIENAWTLDLRSGEGRNLVIRAGRRQRPCLDGSLHIIAGEPGGTLFLDGLLIGGSLRIEGEITLILRHCTVLPRRVAPAIFVRRGEPAASMARVIIEYSIVGPVRLPCEGVSLEISHSIVDGGPDDAILGDTAFGPLTSVDSSTIAGPVSVRGLSASDSMFLDPIRVADPREGYLRYCWRPASSRTPSHVVACLPPPPGDVGDGGLAAPVFISRRPGQPGYFYFTPNTPRAILTGASDDMAFGVFRDLGDVVRLDNYEDALTEYLPYGLSISRVFQT
jgi:hypothetical protein